MEATVDAQSQAAPPPRVRERYEQDVLPALIAKFGYSTPMQAPRLEKITLNMGLGEARQNNKMLEAAQGQLAQIAGQQPNVRRARKSIASFKVREGMPVGVSVTLRRARMWEFLDRLCSIAVPRIRDFRGLNPRSFDGRGNYSMGVKEQLIFPEIDYDSIDEVRGLDVTITTSAATDEEAFELLLGLGMPFAKEGRPGKPDADLEAQEAAEEEKHKEEARERAEAEQAALEQLKEENPEAYERPEEPAPPAGGEAGGTAPEDASATAGGGGSPASTGPAGEDASQDTEKENS
jgi:large subunit ribosomal protein L5